jgi:hypothetical protein
MVATATIQVGRDFNNVGGLKDPDVKPWGCVVTLPSNNPAVRKGARGDECAKFEITSYSDNQFGGEFRFKELYVNQSFMAPHTLFSFSGFLA